jgi:hypothetical protein
MAVQASESPRAMVSRKSRREVFRDARRRSGVLTNIPALWRGGGRGGGLWPVTREWTLTAWLDAASWWGRSQQVLGSIGDYAPSNMRTLAGNAQGTGDGKSTCSSAQSGCVSASEPQLKNGLQWVRGVIGRRRDWR